MALYASLLAALLFLVRPDALRHVQSACATLQSLPLRAQGLLRARPALAHAGRDEDRARQSSREVDGWIARRVAAATVRPPGIPAGFTPRCVVVRERRVRDGAGAMELLLAVPRDALGAAAANWVTVGDVLVGFLEPDGVVDPEDDCCGAARISLLHRRGRGRFPRRVPAWIEDPAGPLAVVVEPASSIDRWPLRCVLPADPYRAAALAHGDPGVWTTGQADDPLGALPAGLRIGALQVYGYEELDGAVVPIGLFVEPALATDEIHAVVVWTRGTADRGLAPARPLESGVLLPARASRLPVSGSVRARWFVTTRELAGAWLEAGAALVHGERLIGELDTAGLGYGIVAPFGQPGRDWPLTLLPDDGGAPVDVTAHAVSRDDGLVTVELRRPLRGFRRGHAFSGAGGRHLPPGLWIGAAVLDDPRVLLIQHVDRVPETGLSVHLHQAVAPVEAR